MKRIYLDNNATTQVDPRLVDLFTSYSLSAYGNPSSIHSFGREAKAILMKARDTLADIFCVRSQEILFTSTATEALNILMRGRLGANADGSMITSSVEHAAVFATACDLQKQGLRVDYLDVGPSGAPSPEILKAALQPDTRLIVLMAANNETGSLSDINAFAEIAQEANIPLIVDGVSLFGKEMFSLHPGISAICFSAHKFYAPKGAAFTVVRKGLKLTPTITGGHQEYGLRPGTENLAAIGAMAQGARLVQGELAQFLEPMRSLRDYFEEEILKIYPKAQINGQGPRIANTSNICFQDLDGEALLMYLDLHGVAASLGSACSSGAIEPTRVLLNMGRTRKQALASLRFSLGRYTTKADLDTCLQIIQRYIHKKI